MDRENTGRSTGVGRYLLRRRAGMGRWLKILMLLAWDGLLLYMMVECLIEPVYGAVFVGAVSVYLGYQF